MRMHIAEQIALLGLERHEAFIANELGDFVDETGYLIADLEYISING